MHLLRLIVLLLLPLLALNAAAQTPTAPAADELRSRLGALAERKLPEADQRAAQQALEQALASLATAEDLRAQARGPAGQRRRRPAGHPRPHANSSPHCRHRQTRCP
jgi:hypothetical protein